MNDFQSILKKAQKKFPTHKRVKIKVKENPCNPHNRIFFFNIINDNTLNQYYLYIHDNYVSIHSLGYENSKTFRIKLDSKLWIELYYIFEIDE